MPIFLTSLLRLACLLTCFYSFKVELLTFPTQTWPLPAVCPITVNYITILPVRDAKNLAFVFDFPLLSVVTCNPSSILEDPPSNDHKLIWHSFYLYYILRSGHPMSLTSLLKYWIAVLLSALTHNPLSTYSVYTNFQNIRPDCILKR